jgi:Homeodomain-like domain
MAPADSLARLRKALIDRAERREAPVTQLCREAGVSRSRFYELRARYLQYGETGLRPKPRPTERPRRQLSEPLVDAIVAYAVEHPTHGQRTIALVLAAERFGGWRVSHGGVANVLRRAGLGRRLARLAAAESLAASEGGPLTERVLRQVRAIDRARTVHIGSDVSGEELFFDTFYVGNLKASARSGS